MATTIPRTLYHYCSIPTFFNIVKNKSIWLSDISKSNDSLELRWIKEQCRYYILKVWVDYVRSVKESVNDLSLVSFDDFENVQKFSELIAKYDLTKSWVFCLTEKKDNLGQWRGYADDGTGVCIGFKTDFYSMIDAVAHYIDKDADLHFRKVRYTKKEIEDFFYNAAELSKIDASMSCQEVIRLLNSAISFTMSNAEFFKNDAFKEEKEWRLVYTMETSDLLKGKVPGMEKFSEKITDMSIGNFGFSTRRGTIISHIEISLPKLDSVFSSITIGPKSSLSINDVKLFLLHSGVIKNTENLSIKIEKSKVSYR
nr:DUF2971 domain-containing protein [uncultured Ruminococcus sp.]